MKSFQYSDVKPLGESQKYGNAAYHVSTILAMNERLSRGMLEAAIRSRTPSNVIHTALRGEWNSLTMQCRVERLDGGEWIASDYKFSKAASKPDFVSRRSRATTREW
jgi:hypothetical protein